MSGNPPNNSPASATVRNRCAGRALPNPSDAAVADDNAAKLAAELRKLQKRHKLAGQEMAAFAGYKQPWWAKVTSGARRRPDVAAISTILVNLEVDGADAARILGYARSLVELYDAQPSTTNPRPKDGPEVVALARELGRLITTYSDLSPMTVTELGIGAGHTQSWMSKVRSGRIHRPDIESIKYLAAELGMPAADASRVVELAEDLGRL